MSDESTKSEIRKRNITTEIQSLQRGAVRLRAGGYGAMGERSASAKASARRGKGAPPRSACQQTVATHEGNFTVYTVTPVAKSINSLYSLRIDPSA